MNQILQKYAQYLAKLGKTQLQKQMNLMQIDPTFFKEKKQFINLLLDINPSLIKSRVAEIQQTNIQKKTLEESTPLVSDSVKIEQKQRKNKKKTADVRIEEIRSHIYKVFAEKFDKMVKGDLPIAEKNVEKKKNISLNDLIFFKASPINTLLNCKQEIQFHSSKIKYQYQRTIEELLYSFFPQRTIVDIQAKSKLEAKELLPQNFIFEGNPIEKILILYGIKKEEQFLQDFKDPLQLLLQSNSSNHEKTISLLILILEKLSQRSQYYQAVISSLDAEQLFSLVGVFEKMTNISSYSECFKMSSSLLFVKMVRKNKRIFDSKHYLRLLGLDSSDKESLQIRIGIEKWILSTLESFSEMVKNHLFTKQEQSNLMEKILVYKQIKEQIQEELFSVDWEKSQLIRMVTQSINQTQRDVKFILNAFSERQSELFNDKIKEVLLFLDPNVNTEPQIKEKLVLYSNILNYFFVLEKCHLPPDIIHKIISDLDILTKKQMTLDEKSFHSLDKLKTTVEKHLIPLAAGQDSRNKLENILKCLQDDLNHSCKL